MNLKHKKHDENCTKHIKSNCSKPVFKKKILRAARGGKITYKIKKIWMTADFSSETM